MIMRHASGRFSPHSPWPVPVTFHCAAAGPWGWFNALWCFNQPSSDDTKHVHAAKGLHTTEWGPEENPLETERAGRCKCVLDFLTYLPTMLLEWAAFGVRTGNTCGGAITMLYIDQTWDAFPLGSSSLTLRGPLSCLGKCLKQDTCTPKIEPIQVTVFCNMEFASVWDRVSWKNLKKRRKMSLLYSVFAFCHQMSVNEKTQMRDSLLTRPPHWAVVVGSNPIRTRDLRCS